MAKEYFLDRDKFFDSDGQPPSGINLRYRLGREMDELLGICRGVLADKFVVEAEAKYLQDWLERNQEIVPVWPARGLALRLSRILADGVVSDEEREELTLFIEKVTGEASVKLADANETLIRNATKASALPIDDPPPEIVFEMKIFCFTGKLLSGTRAWCSGEVSKRGGLLCDTGARCDYLVVGVLGSRDWAHSSFGRKIEAAVKRKRTPTSGPKIVAEQHWIKHVNLVTPKLGS
jgi:hypothetical protein